MRNLTAALLIFAASASCGRAPGSDERTGASGSGSSAAPWSVAAQAIPSPSGPNSSAPQLSVSERGVMLSWMERTETTSQLKFAERTASGWTAPVVAASGDDWFVSYADPPSVLRLSDGTLVAQWERQTDPVLEAMDLSLAYSSDNGKSWSRPFTPHHDGTKTQHAFASFFELPGRTLGLVWLDGRESYSETDDPAGGSMTMRFAAFDNTWKQIADAELDGRVCECCSTSAAVTANGAIVAFRDRTEKEIRDIAVVRLENGKWTDATRVFSDNWEIHACPVNGPALTARGRQVAVAWFTVKNDQGQAYAAFSNDAGRTWGAPIRLDDAASLGRVDIELLDDGSAVATWVEYANGRGQFRLRRVEPSGARSAAITVAGVQGSSTSGFPRLERNGDELVLAWAESADSAGTDTAQIVRTAVARLPE